MQIVSRFTPKDNLMLFGIVFLILISFIVLRSVSPVVFPLYFLFIILGFFGYFIFLQVDFDILLLFSRHLYLLSIILLIAPLVIGQVTRGAIRWIPLGPLTIQPSEIVRPFILIFFANYLIKKELNLKRLVSSLLLLLVPFTLILIQPSLGVAVITLIGFFGVFLASPIKKKYILMGFGFFLVLMPLFWSLLAPYQKQRIGTFVDPYSDPQGVGYNSIQSMISVGSGRLTGRGLGEGVQTQLAFLPEKHTDFIFAATAEELGFVGSGFLLAGLMLILWRLIKIVENPSSPYARAYVSGFFLATFAETTIHIGMNVGLLPITGIPLPLVSAGGSAFLASMVGLAIAVNAKKRAHLS